MKSPGLEACLWEAMALKSVDRAGWRRAGVAHPESVADHSWGTAWLVLALCPEEIDRGRALSIALIHDLAEVRTGDITPHDGVSEDEKRRREQGALDALVEPLPRAGELRELWREFEDGTSPEGRFVRACDKLDMALQARRYASDQALDPSEFIASALAALSDPTLRRLARGRNND